MYSVQRDGAFEAPQLRDTPLHLVEAAVPVVRDHVRALQAEAIGRRVAVALGPAALEDAERDRLARGVHGARPADELARQLERALGLVGDLDVPVREIRIVRLVEEVPAVDARIVPRPEGGRQRPLAHLLSRD
jgi:hypothetical protein